MASHRSVLQTGERVTLNWPGVDYSAAHKGKKINKNWASPPSFTNSCEGSLAPPRRPLPFPVTTEPYFQIAVNDFSRSDGQPCLVGSPVRGGRFAVGVLWHVISDVVGEEGGGSDTGCSLNRNQLPLKENTGHPWIPDPSSSVLRLQVGNFDGSTKRCLGDPGVEIRRTIRPGKGRRVEVVVEVLGSKEKEKGGGFTTSGESVCFFHTPSFPFFLPPPPSLMRGGGKKKKKNEVPWSLKECLTSEVFW